MVRIAFWIVAMALFVSLAFMPADASDFTLGIFGNANMDDTIDEQDIEYVQGIIDGTNDETKLADANYDGAVDEGDINQIELIIAGEEEELIVEDDMNVVVHVSMPVKTAITADKSHAEALRAIKSSENIIAITEGIKNKPIFFSDLVGLPSVASEYGKEPDYETILELAPDLYLTAIPASCEDDKRNLPGISVICLNLWEPAGFKERVIKLGYILDKREEAREYVEWHTDTVKMIKTRIEDNPGNDQPRILLASVYGDTINVHTNRSGAGQILSLINVRTLGDTLMGTHPELDPEWVIEQNPEVILLFGPPESVDRGYDTDDYSDMKNFREDLMEDPKFALTDAVTSGRIYVLDSDAMSYSGSYIIGMAYMAKMFYPDLFEDFNPQSVHQEYLSRFQDLDYDLNEHGVFVYPSDGGVELS